MFTTYVIMTKVTSAIAHAPRTRMLKILTELRKKFEKIYENPYRCKIFFQERMIFHRTGQLGLR